MERIYAFLPSILIIACIAGATFLYLKLVIKRFGDNFKSVEWHRENKRKVIWTVSIPLILIYGPSLEELIFRAPLIIAFSEMSSFAWYGVFASSGIFALLHWFGKKIWLPEVFSAREKNEHETDSIKEEVKRLHQKAGKEIIVRKALSVVFSLLVGILAGYYGIKYQSIWVSFGIHLVWNLTAPIMISLLLLLGGLVFLGISSLGMLAYLGISSQWNKVRWRRRMSL